MAGPRRSLCIWAAVLFLVAMATRWPLRGRVLEEYDSANYALAILELDLFREQPHPPGYIFSVWAARAAHRWTGDPIAALTAVAACSGAVAAVLLFLLCAPAVGNTTAGVATLATLAATQVWLQQTRPLQDAFAFAWMLAAAGALVWSVERGGLGRWAAACAFVGLSAGAKQVLPVFLCGLVAWSGAAAWRRGGWRWPALGAAAALAASLAWLVPLSVHCGSLWTYLEWALGQVAWQRQHDAALFRASLDRVGPQFQATFVTAVGPPWLALLLWPAAVIGAVDVVRRRQAAWMLWLLLPLLVLRLLLLGTWPRFALYYVPFVTVLAAAGVRRVVESRASIACLRTPAYFVLFAVWSGGHALHVLPTLRALHRGPSPVDEALRVVAARRPAGETLVLTDGGTLARHVEYYARRRGLAHVVEERFEAGALRGRRHVVKLHGARATLSASWTGQGEALGAWTLAVPRRTELSPVDDFWHVAAFESRGSYVVRRRFHIDAAGRWLATATSAIVVFRAPEAGFTLRVTAIARGTVRFVVAQRRPLDWDGGGATFDVAIEPGEIVDGRVRVDVVPACDGDPQCLEVQDVSVVPRR